MPIHVVNEAKRCLQCKNPRCRTGCPIQTPIPDMIRLFRENRWRKRGRCFSATTPCRWSVRWSATTKSSARGIASRASRARRYTSPASKITFRTPTWIGWSSRRSLPRGSGWPSSGSGPAGLTIAVLLAQRGYSVTLFESREQIGGVLRYGIPEFRLPKEILDRYKTQLEKLGIKIRPNTAIGQALTIDDLQRDGYEAIFIGTGVWRPKKLGIPGESLGNVHFAIDYLVNPDVYNLGSE